MFNRFICFLLGHKGISDIDILVNDIKRAAINSEQLNTNLVCPRCGVRL